MKQAKPTESQFDAVNDFFQGLEQICEDGTVPETVSENESDMVEWINHQWEKGVDSYWRRVLFAGKVALDACSDPGAGTVEWRKELVELLAAAKAAKVYLDPDLIEPGRTVFWRLVSAIAAAEKVLT